MNHEVATSLGHEHSLVFWLVGWFLSQAVRVWKAVTFFVKIISFSRDISYNAIFTLTFICPCITNIYPSYNQKDATFPPPIIRSTKLYCRLCLFNTAV